MKLPQRQRGMTMLSMLMLAVMVGFFVLCAIRMMPVYFEFLSVQEIVEKVSAEHKRDETTVRDIQRRLENLFNTNQIYELKPRDVKVYRQDGETHIDANYESRIPLFWRVDAVLKFDDLHYIAGQSEPLPPPESK